MIPIMNRPVVQATATVANHARCRASLVGYGLHQTRTSQARTGANATIA